VNLTVETRTFPGGVVLTRYEKGANRCPPSLSVASPPRRLTGRRLNKKGSGGVRRCQVESVMRNRLAIMATTDTPAVNGAAIRYVSRRQAPVRPRSPSPSRPLLWHHRRRTVQPQEDLGRRPRCQEERKKLRRATDQARLSYLIRVANYSRYS
jgi:hypothetical protein